MNVSELTNSKFLKQDDVPQPQLVTIKAVSKENVSPPNQPSKMRGVMYFEELTKPMVLNKTNLNRCQQAFRSGDTDDWVGQKIVVFVDNEVEYGGEIVGGLRLRAPKGQKPKVEDLENDIPF